MWDLRMWGGALLHTSRSSTRCLNAMHLVVPNDKVTGVDKTLHDA